MNRIILAVCALGTGAVWAQPSDAGHQERDARESGSELSGTPQKPDPGPDAGILSPVATPQSGASADRPDEDSMFGSSGGETPQADQGNQPPAADVAETLREGAQPESQDEQGLGGAVVNRFEEGSEADDTLQIGGLFYQRLFATNRAGTGFSNTTLSVPTLVDGYFDGRPNDRLRAMVVARLRYDATTDEAAVQSRVLGRPRENPSVTLDQLWLSFDIARKVFVTAGRQHVKWGTARFWNPTDFLHTVRRDSLALFDERTGTNMIRFNIPAESLGANFTAIALLEGARGAATLGGVGAAGRAEVVLGETEVGLDALVQHGARPKYGADLSTALGPIDVYAEAALKAGPAFRYEEAAFQPTPLFTLYEENEVATYGLSAAGGLTWTFAYTENDTATVGAEYFYNPNGYADPEVYEFLLINGAFQPFYTGQHYASVYALVAGPGTWDKTAFVLSNLANLSDKSFVSRLDFTVRVLTYLTVEANVSVFYGNPDGELRLRLQVPGHLIGGSDFTLPEQRFTAGLGLRMDL